MVRIIKRTARFKRDYKCEKMGRHRSYLDAALLAGLRYLIKDLSLPKRYYDHPLTGNWKDHRDCHIKPDLILIYRLPDPKMLELVRLGSHSELSL